MADPRAHEVENRARALAHGVVLAMVRDAMDQVRQLVAAASLEDVPVGRTTINGMLDNVRDALMDALVEQQLSVELDKLVAEARKSAP